MSLVFVSLEFYVLARATERRTNIKREAIRFQSELLTQIDDYEKETLQLGHSASNTALLLIKCNLTPAMQLFYHYFPLLFLLSKSIQDISPCVEQNSLVFFFLFVYYCFVSSVLPLFKNVPYQQDSYSVHGVYAVLWVFEEFA